MRITSHICRRMICAVRMSPPRIFRSVKLDDPDASSSMACCGSTKWDDHEMVKVILRSLVFRNPTQVQLIRGDPRYKLRSPEEVIGKFVSFELMIKDSKHIVNLDQGATSTPEVQPVTFKAMEEEKESTSSRLPIDFSKLDNEEMMLIIESFRQILKQRRGKDYKSRSKKVCYRCGKSGHFIAKFDTPVSPRVSLKC